MVNFDILYKFYYNNENFGIIKEKPYYFIHFEANNSNNQITKQFLKEKLIEDGYNPNYFDLNPEWTYLLIEEKDNSSNIMEDNIVLNNEIKEDGIKYEGEGPFILYLHLIIDIEKENERIKKENDKEKNDIKAQYSNIEQISNELSDIKRQINYIKKNKRNELKEMINLYPKTMIYNKNLDNANNINKLNTQTISIKFSKEFNSNTQTVIPENKIEENINFCKIYFLFSSPLKQGNNGSKYIKEDFSYFTQFLNIYNTIKEQKDIIVELHLNQIPENFDIYKNPDILHIRVDSIQKENQIYFKLGADNNIIGKEYLLDDFISKFDKIKDLKLLIISSQNINEIKKKLNEMQNLKRINKIYINHSKETEEEENKFIQNFYFNCINKKQNIMNSCLKNNNNIDIDINIIDDQYCFEENNKNIDKEFFHFNQEEKNALKFEKVKNDYCIIGRSEELYTCLIKFLNGDNKICVYGPKGVGKKSFAKKVGFSCYERNIFDKVYFLGINSIDNENNPELKINMLIDEICENHHEYNSDIKVLLIIYFKEPISKIDELNEIILKNETSKKNNIIISYLYTFTLDEGDISKGNINVLPNRIELTHFQKYGNEEKKIDNFKDLFNFCVKEKNINDKKNLIDKVNDFFDKLITQIDIKELEKFKEENIDENNEKKEENHEILKGAKINNIFLLVSYISFSEKENIEIDNIFSELILKDNEEKKKTIISEMLGSDKVKEIIFYLNELNSGIGENLLMNLLFANEEIEEEEEEKGEKKINIIKYIKEKLFGLIIVEIKGNEEIFRLDNSLKNLIEELINEKKLIDEEKKKQIKFNVLKNYCYLFRNVLKNYQTDNEGFHACIPNNFWFNKKISSDLMNGESKYIFHRTLDSINIYNIINNINIDDYKNDNILQLYIDDISISLPTLLYFTNNIYYEYLIISLFEKLFEYLKEENDTKINELILRLGIFKYWVSKNPNFFQKSLELAGLSDENNICLNKEAKFEYYLSKIFDCIIKKNKNIEQFSYECKRILKEEKSDNNELNEKRLNNLCSQALNKIDQNPKNTFYFLLQNPLNSQFKTKSNRNFYLTQKLLTILPSNYGVEFKTLENNDYLKENENNLKNMRFLYLESKNDELFDFFKKEKKMNIKILKIILLNLFMNLFL